jgi:hypothetical protein
MPSTNNTGSNQGMGELGASGLNYSNGYVLDELNPNLQGRKALITYRLMRDNDAVVGAILYAIEMLIRQVDWTVQKGDAADSEAQFLEEVMEDMSESWGDFIAEAFSMLPYGWAFCEVVYKKRSGIQDPDAPMPSSKYNDGKIGWRKLPLRAQDSLDHWEFDDQGGLRGFVQRPAPHYVDIEIPIEKGLLFRTTPYKGSPEGRSVLRSAYTSWYYKKRIQQIEGTGIERDLAGFPVFEIPAEFMAADASTEQKAVLSAFQNMGKNIRRDKQEFVIMPLAYDSNGNKAYDFKLMSSGGARTFNTSEIIARYNNEIAMTVLADFILLGHEGVGSFALSNDKTDLFGVALGTYLDAVEDVLNRYAIPRLFALNGMDVTNLPKIKHGDIETPDLASLGAYVTALSGIGMPLFPNDDLEKYLLVSANLPEPTDEEKAKQSETPPTPVPPAGGGAPVAPTDGQPTDGSGSGSAPSSAADYLSQLGYGPGAASSPPAAKQ